MSTSAEILKMTVHTYSWNSVNIFKNSEINLEKYYLFIIENTLVCVCVCAVSYTHLDVYKRQE